MNLRTVPWNRPQQRLLRTTIGVFFLNLLQVVCDWIVTVTVAIVSAVYNQIMYTDTDITYITSSEHLITEAHSQPQVSLPTVWILWEYQKKYRNVSGAEWLVATNQPNPAPLSIGVTGSWILNTPAERIANATPFVGMMETKSRVQLKSSSNQWEGQLTNNGIPTMG